VVPVLVPMTEAVGPTVVAVEVGPTVVAVAVGLAAEEATGKGTK